MQLQLVDKHGEVIGFITYAATIHSAVHISEHTEQARRRQQLEDLSSSSSQSEQRSLSLKESTTDGMHSRHDNSQAMQIASSQPGQQLSQVADADEDQARLESMESEAFIYSSTGQSLKLCCHKCSQQGLLINIASNSMTEVANWVNQSIHHSHICWYLPLGITALYI